ncbi:MAG: exopolysaccharide biosynthesis polyprenyl glycosylphosphotransferase [Firmicutes bacterium]|nr:exopolysaccharide biosynthesis polyprenyl glycosylphosphotransferase [Bacillota bacterium]
MNQSLDSVRIAAAKGFFTCGIKRLFDILAGMIILVLVIPIMGVVAVMIKLNSRGPVFYIDSRLGKNGRYFRCYKFRTMKQNCESVLEEYLRTEPMAEKEWERFAKLRCFDPRLTTIGAKLRKYSIDELPQLINVIKGEMSLVGPRPYLPREEKQMGYSVSIILQTTPGITGLWQVSGRNSIDFPGRLLMDEWYVQNQTLWLDIIILFKTIRVVVNGHDAY